MLVEYVWIDGYGHPRSKTRVLYQKKPDKMEDINIPHWNYDGSSTGQAEGSNSEVVLVPCSVFSDPFRGGDSLMVLCETQTPDLSPHPTNTRDKARKIFDLWPNSEPMFGIEQEFFIMKNDDILALSPNNTTNIAKEHLVPQGHYYCGAGANNAIGREVVEMAFKRCIIAGIHVTGLNAEVAPSQWEIQVCATGISAADQLIMMRYILNRTAEMLGLWINYEPCPISSRSAKKQTEDDIGFNPDNDNNNKWNASGCHVNFSTKTMRADGGYQHIVNAINKLEASHEKHIKAYGKDNDLRLTGKNETSDMHTFSSGVGNRGASIRIPTTTMKEGKGYFEDRRPCSNMDPYVVTSLILETSLSN